MNIEKQVCSLEYAKQLKKLGIRQESYFVWVDIFPVFNDELRLSSKEELERQKNVSILSEDAKALIPFYSAFTVAELGEILSTCRLRSERLELTLSVYHTGTFKNLYCKTEQDSHIDQHIEDENEANCRARMLIYLIENGLITN